MIESARRPSYSYDDYIQVDEDSHVRHEFLDGQIYAMAGGSPEHAELAANVITALRTPSHDRRHIEIWRRAVAATWVRVGCEAGTTVKLEAVPTEIPVDELYGDVRVGT